MLAKSFSFLFYLKKRANQTPEKLPVYLRIYIEGQRSEIFTGRHCEPEKWNRKAERMIGLKEEVRLFNAYLVMALFNSLWLLKPSDWTRSLITPKAT